MKLASFAILVATIALVSSPASAAWQEYIYEDLGIAKAFPVAPERTEGLYETPEFARDATEDEVVANVLLSQYQDLGGYDQQREVVVRRTYQDLKGILP